MKIGIFSGSFNPIHLGHTMLARYILEQAGLDEVWLMVSPNNPLKAASGLLDEQIRYRMAEMATADEPGLRASDFELHLPRPSYSVVTLAALRQTYPEHEFALIIGSDNMAIFHLWREYETILREYPVIVYPREGDDLGPLEEKYPEMRVVEGAPLLRISATDIRTRLAEGAVLTEWLHPSVAQFLQDNPDLWQAK